MKKFMMALAFVGLGTVAANAQCDEFAAPTTTKYSVATNSFWSNWYIQFGIDASMMMNTGSDGASFSNYWHANKNYGLNLAIGKWFTPGIGGRLKLNYNMFSFRDTKSHNYFNGNGTDNYGSLVYDNLFNLSNLFCGYNESRVWNVSVFPRMGIMCNFQEGKVYSPVLGVGLESSWKLGKVVGIYVDAAYNFVTGKITPNAAHPGCINGTSFGAAGNLQVDLGVTFNLGKSGWSKAVRLEDYEALSAEACAKLADLRKQLQAEKDENARLRDLLARQPKEKPAEKIITPSSATSVFFNINSSKLNSKKDLINLEAVATAAKNAGSKVVVTGSADSKTGSDAYNQKLSEARAQAVADELVNLGVDRNNIEIKGVGGVNNVTPYTLNRRAIIELK